jgi:hypothetical protein
MNNKDFFDLTYDYLNKLFCTFTKKEDLQLTISDIKTRYTIVYSKIFILETDNDNEYVCTYNIDSDNVNRDTILPNTILMHRRKECNVLYTINSLNKLIESLNGGVRDPNYRVNWKDYENSILLTQNNSFVHLKTKIHDIVHLEKNNFAN